MASTEVSEALFERCDFAEPDLVSGFGQAGFRVGGHVLDAADLGGVDAEEAAPGAGVFMDAGCAVGAVAAAESDLAEQEVLLELGPFVAGRGSQFAVGSQLSTPLDGRFVGGDDVLGEHGGVAAGGVEAEVAEQAGRDVQWQPGTDEFGGEQAAEVVRGEVDGAVGVAQAGPGGGAAQQGADVERRDHFLAGA